MRLPNGYGSVTKLTGKRRKPWIVRTKEICRVEGKKLISERKILGYYRTRTEALAALAEYNGKPYNLDMAALTFRELYDLWSADYFRTLAPTSTGSHKAAFKHCVPLYDIPFRNLRAAHLQQCIDDSGTAYATQKKMRNLFGLMYKYALANDSADKNYTQYVRIADFEIQHEHIPFTEEEIARLKEIAPTVPYADTILIMIYTGWRITELLTLRRDDVDMTELTMRGGMKTDAGKNRLVPMHPVIEPYVRKYYAQGGRTLLPSMSYSTYAARFKEIAPGHRPHDCRHTFATRADNYGMNKVCLQRIMGHASRDITEKVYTHKDLDELRKAILLLP